MGFDHHGWRGDDARRAAVLAGGVALVSLTGCSQQLKDQFGRVGMLAPASDRAHYMSSLWIGAWIACAVIGVLVWGLIGLAIFRFRRRRGNLVPKQTKYHLPIELLYTLVPFLIIGVLFFYTVRAQDNVLKKNGPSQHTIDVVGQKWSWTFNYMEQNNSAIGATVHQVGTIENIPDLYLPINESVTFNLLSADVDHSFWIPAFYFKMDVIPGHPNSFQVTPTRIGVFDGKCAELCGTYHSAMLFTVHVVSVDEYNAYVKSLAAKGQIGELKPPLGVNSPLPVTSEGTGK